MCGIAGLISNEPLSTYKIRSTLDLMKNRGPDFASFKEFRVNNKFIYLLHSRLSIIDLDQRSNQPFTINDYTLIFNGEIYNYIELRDLLVRRGYKFRTKSDTEVLLNAYIEFKDDVECYLEGMWAFAIWNNNSQSIYLSRDRFSEKPLYYAKSPNFFCFGSEIKFIKSLSFRKFDLNLQTIKRFLSYGYRSIYKAGQTYFNDIFQLKGASSIKIKADSLITEEKRYWKPEIKTNDDCKDIIIRKTRDLIYKSLDMRLRSDTPIAFNLSGGIDSSTLVSIAQKEFGYDVNTFSIIDDDPRYNERKNIDIVLNEIKSNHLNINLKGRFSFTKLKDLIEYHDQPICTINYYAHSLLQEEISKNGFKISISGTGADEIFTGYYDHHLYYLYEMRHHSKFSVFEDNWKRYVLKNIQNPNLRNINLFQENGDDYRDYIYDDFKYLSFLNDVSFKDEIKDEIYFNSSILKNRMANELFDEIVPILLENEDLNSMFYSVENRSPYLDSKLYEYVLSVPSEYYIENGFSKNILREISIDLLDSRVRLDREKKGFNASLNSIINIKDKSNISYLLEDSPIFEIINKKNLEEFIYKSNFELNDEKKFLFNFLNCKIFMETQYSI